MRRLGQLLAILGLLLGTFVGLSLFLPLTLSGWAWLIAAGMVKLSFLSAVGLIAGGAVLQRLAKRQAVLQLESATTPLPPPPPPVR